MMQQALDFSGNTPQSAYDRLMSEPRKVGERMANKAAQRCAPDFVARASKFVTDYLAMRGQAPGEIVVDLAKQAGIVATDDRAFGVVFSGLSRNGVIRCVGYCERRKGHGTAGGRIWAIVL
jgi:hypothetical protein